MKKITPFIVCIVFLTSAFESKAQVWFPEGGYNFAQPTAFSIDNAQIYTIGKASEDASKSYWVAAKYDGKSWIKLPILALNKTAEVLEIKAYAGSLYVAGNFTYDNGAYAALVRFKDAVWQPVAKIERINQVTPVISALEIFENKLIIGGNFNKIGNDSLPYIAAYNGLAFSNILSMIPNCKRCYPNYFVTDLAANDSFLAISGYFNQIADQSSKSLFLLKTNGKTDTFATTPNNMLFEKITIAQNSKVIFGTGINPSDKRINIFKVQGIFTDLKLNFDTIAKVNDLVIFDNNLWMNGLAKLSGKNAKSVTLQLNNTIWTDYTSNYLGANSIVAGRGSLYAIGHASQPLSIWNNNTHIVRFYRNSALVKVSVFLDSNSNCIQEKTEKMAAKQLVKLSLPLVNKFSVTNELGLAEFLFNIPINATKVPFNIILARNYKTSSCASDTIFRTFAANVKFIDSIQFPISRKTNINDIRVGISAPKGTQVIKDKRMEYIIFIENVGSNIVSGNLILKKNKWLSSEKTDGKLDTVKVEWSYANLNPGEKRYYTYSGVASDSRFVENTMLQAQASATIASLQNDYKGDDSDSIEQIIDNNYYPFRKDIYPIPNPGDSISYLTMNEREIRYLISFNNFSADTVFNAVITDTLDLNLDMSYIQETGSNKPYYTEIQTDPNNSYKGIIIWHFPNINLSPNPLKNFEIPNSGSYIGFKVVMKPISNGYILKNTAAVFYDNLYEGKTNSAYCTIVNTGLDNIRRGNNTFLTYPNPASSSLEFEMQLQTGDRISIINQQGLQLKSVQISEPCNHYSSEIADLSSGIYVVKVVKGSQIFYSKFVKL